jgi:Tfp pilus assembly protein PilV
MRHRNRQRGATLLEALLAMSVLMVGSAGMLALHRVGIKIEADSRRLTRGTAIAQDLLNQVELWTYADPRLANRLTGNDAKIGDPAFEYEQAADPLVALADHGEADLTAAGAVWLGLPTAAIGDYQRFWSVAYPDDTNGNGVPDSVRIAILVRWPSMGAWRRVVLLSTKPNPVEAR